MNAIESLYGFESSPGGKPAKPQTELGKEDFLNLLVVQLKNQDPLNPSDPTEFTAQLAQYSSLEQLYNINDSMKALDAMSGEFSRLSALSLIDRNVVVNDNKFQLDNSPAALGFSFQDPVRPVTVYIRNEAGESVHQITVANPAAGENRVQWDGRDRDGNVMPPGKYTFTVVGKTTEGTDVQGKPLVESRVTGVDFSGPGETLLTDNGNIGLSDITRISR